ncbi:MAG: type II toxin-antitoxin system VapB family antitoxin [Alphaproteobacteria bacterium]
MALNIKSAEADRLARELADLTGESITEAVTKAVRERIERSQRAKKESIKALLAGIRERVSKLPVLDDRPIDEILGYNEFGTFD